MSSLISGGAGLLLATALLLALLGCSSGGLNPDCTSAEQADCALLGVHIQTFDGGVLHTTTCAGASTACGSCLSTACCSDLAACGNDPTCLCLLRCASSSSSSSCSACMPDGAAADTIWSALGTCASARCGACAEVIP